MGRRKKSNHEPPDNQQSTPQENSSGVSTSTPGHESNEGGASGSNSSFSPSEVSQRGRGRGRGRVGNIARPHSHQQLPLSVEHEPQSGRLNLGEDDFPALGQPRSKPRMLPQAAHPELQQQLEELQLEDEDVLPAVQVLEVPECTSMEISYQIDGPQSYPEQAIFQQEYGYQQQFVQHSLGASSTQPVQYQQEQMFPLQVPYHQQMQYQMFASQHGQQYLATTQHEHHIQHQQHQQHEQHQQHHHYQQQLPGTISSEEQLQYQQQMQGNNLQEQMLQFQQQMQQGTPQYHMGAPQQLVTSPQLHLITLQASQLPYQMFSSLQQPQLQPQTAQGTTPQEELPYQLFTPPPAETPSEQPVPVSVSVPVPLAGTSQQAEQYHHISQQIPYQMISAQQQQQYHWNHHHHHHQQHMISTQELNAISECDSPDVTPQMLIPNETLTQQMVISKQEETTSSQHTVIIPKQEVLPAPPQKEQVQVEVAVAVEEVVPDTDDTTTLTAGPAKVVEPVSANFRQGGSKGRKIQVLTNHFPLHLSPKITTAYQYDVTIEPERPKKLLPVVMQQMQKIYYPNNHPAYDGMKNLISAYELPLPLPITGTIKITEDGREKEYSVKIQLASVVDFTVLTRFFNQKLENQMVPPMHVLQCLDIVLRSRPSTTMITAGRSYFSVPDQIVRLGNGMEMYRGFYQSAILGWKPFLNVDVSHKAFPSAMSILDLIKDIDSKADLGLPLSRYVEHKLSKYIYNLKIEYIMPNKPLSKRTYRALSVEKNANNYLFTNSKGRQLSVAQYFKEDKKYTLKYPHLPCLWVGSKLRNAKVVLPCELCSVASGQVTNQKMDEMQTRNMIKSATTSTSVRKDHIIGSLKVANHNDSPVMKEFGLSVDSHMTEVTARVLEPPKIKYQNCLQPVVRGAWKGGPFHTPIALNKWAILCLDGRIPDSQINEFKESFIRQARLWKMNINANVRVNRLDLDRIAEDNIYNSMYSQFSQYQTDKMQLIVVVLNDRRSDTYANVKKIAELDTGCLTQCMRGSTIFRLALRTIDNLLQKANAKLNGINHLWHERPIIMNRPVIIMGADVTHPSPDAKDATPSVAAVTASQDPQAAVYNIIWRLQDPRAEIITDLEAITRRQLMKFYETTSHKPEKIIFYRDGVSDGQFDEVRKKEIQAVRNACSSLNTNYKPAITFLVVQKRHHTRLFPVRSSDSEDQNGNVPAGTVVDTHITHPITQDFYLVSHSSGQGVARPTKYRTLWDDSDLSDDNIEQLTFYLCHMFIRCNKSVSYPAPTFYAHLAAARAKVYFEDRPWKDFKDLNKLQEQVKTVDEIQIDHPMFFV